MSFFAQNLKYLRTQAPGRARYTQQALADALGLKRTAINDYEAGRSEPSLATLARMAAFFGISLDRLLRQGLEQMPPAAEAAPEPAGLLRVLTLTVSPEGRQNVELVPVPALAGYAAGYGDPEFLRELPRYRLPGLSDQRTYRIFPIQGDSMPPINPGDLVVGEYVEAATVLKPGEPCIVVTRQEGVVFKCLYPRLAQNPPALRLRSTNPLYDPYDIATDDVLELWRFAGAVTFSFPVPGAS